MKNAAENPHYYFEKRKNIRLYDQKCVNLEQKPIFWSHFFANFLQNVLNILYLKKGF